MQDPYMILQRAAFNVRLCILFYQGFTKTKDLLYYTDNSDIQCLPATAMTHSGSTACPASSINTWVKWPMGIPPDTSLKTKTHSSHTTLVNSKMFML